MAIHSQYVTGRKVSILIYPWVFQEANIFSEYSLCSSIPFEELTASPSSAYVVSLLVAEFTASLETAGVSLCTLVGSPHTPTLASAYALSTAVT